MYDFVAQQNPDGANELLKKYAYPTSYKIELIASRLKDIVNKNGEAALADIAKIHPDKELILKYQDDKKYCAGFSNACGCMSADGSIEGFKNAEANVPVNSSASAGMPIKMTVNNNEKILMAVAVVGFLYFFIKELS